MKSFHKILFFAIAVMSLATVPFAIADLVKTSTQVDFNVGSVTGFSLTLPGQSAVAATGPGAATTAVAFNSSNGTHANVNPNVVGGNTQNSTLPIFVYQNTGTININLSIGLDTNPDACITLSGNTTYAGVDVGLPINATSNTTIVTGLTPTSSQNWFMKADFASCDSGASSSKTLTSYGQG